MAHLIDTSVFIAEERRGAPVADVLDHLGDADVAIAAVTASELLVGVFRARPEWRQLARGRYVEEVLRRITAIAFNLTIARVHARLTADLTSAGVRIGEHDLQIAATALTFGYAVLTANVRDFGRVPGLVVANFADLS